MDLTFYSIDSNNDKVIYHTSYIKSENTIIFDDKSVSNTKIYLTIDDNKVLFERKGNVSMKILLEEDKLSFCHYENEMGLSFDFTVVTTYLSISNKRIEMAYELFLENDMISNHKITIIFH